MSSRVLMKHKAFVGRMIYWRGTLRPNRERIRQEAEDFINQMGADKVVSVAEHAMTLGPFSVVVWYREDGQSVSTRQSGRVCAARRFDLSAPGG